MQRRGPRDRVIRIERVLEQTDSMGADDAVNWTLVERHAAQVRYGTSAERRDAAGAGAIQAATFRIDQTAATLEIDPATYRIVDDRDVWNITSAIPAGRSDMEITATRALG